MKNADEQLYHLQQGCPKDKARIAELEGLLQDKLAAKTSTSDQPQTALGTSEFTEGTDQASQLVAELNLAKEQIMSYRLQQEKTEGTISELEEKLSKQDVQMTLAGYNRRAMSSAVSSVSPDGSPSLSDVVTCFADPDARTQVLGTSLNGSDSPPLLILSPISDSETPGYRIQEDLIGELHNQLRAAHSQVAQLQQSITSQAATEEHAQNDRQLMQVGAQENTPDDVDLRGWISIGESESGSVADWFAKPSRQSVVLHQEEPPVVTAAERAEVVEIHNELRAAHAALNVTLQGKDRELDKLKASQEKMREVEAARDELALKVEALEAASIMSKLENVANIAELETDSEQLRVCVAQLQLQIEQERAASSSNVREQAHFAQQIEVWETTRCELDSVEEQVAELHLELQSAERLISEAKSNEVAQVEIIEWLEDQLKAALAQNNKQSALQQELAECQELMELMELELASLQKEEEHEVSSQTLFVTLLRSLTLSSVPFVTLCRCPQHSLSLSDTLCCCPQHSLTLSDTLGCCPQHSLTLSDPLPQVGSCKAEIAELEDLLLVADDQLQLARGDSLSFW